MFLLDGRQKQALMEDWTVLGHMGVFQDANGFGQGQAGKGLFALHESEHRAISSNPGSK